MHTVELSPFPVPGVRPCTLRVALPPGLMPPRGWPTAYVLDQKQFDVMCADPGGLPGLLVGLGPRVPADRAREYVPAGWQPLPGPADAALAGALPMVSPRLVPSPASVGTAPARAGAAAWLRTLDQARSHIAGDFRLDPDRQVFCGHSLGALFGLYVLLHRPRAFSGYVLSSPSVWWGGRYLDRLLRRRLAWLCRQGVPPLGLWLSVGAHEQGLSPREARDPALDAAARRQRLSQRQARGMVDGMRALSARVAACPDLRLHSAVLPGHTHQSASVDALMPGWRWLLAAAGEPDA
ncbi:serine aminopeptidase domain-containing protein [Castellaniella hirudinis]|uniref:serine aminopeptidase domain-containing protein n=1 Tax=Castellaniella hirudinis TaxID=1144617 RepID=UPI0039C37649